MARYRHELPQTSGEPFVTDGGLETVLLFREHVELPEFAAFALLDNEEGREMLRNYFRAYAAMARDQGTGLLLESMTWRASRDWGAKLGYGPEALADLNRRGIALLAEVRDAFDDDIPHIVISGCLGPRGDGYRAEDAMSAAEAEAYHRPQIAAFRETEADLVSALTMTNVEEAVGVVQAAQAEEMPIVVSFTVETDGNLPSGVSLQAASKRWMPLRMPRPPIT